MKISTRANNLQRLNLFFDLDGTLLDTLPDIRACLVEALTIHHLNTDQIDTLIQVGPPLDVMLQSICPQATESTRQRVIHTFRELYDTSGYSRTVVYDGINDLIAQLASVGNLYVATNKVYLPTQRLIQKFGWKSFFKDILSPDRFEGKKYTKSALIQNVLLHEAMKCEWSVLIGDHPSDVYSAREAHISSVAVTWGYTPLETLKDACPDAVVETVDELQAWIYSFRKECAYV